MSSITIGVRSIDLPVTCAKSLATPITVAGVTTRLRQAKFTARQMHLPKCDQQHVNTVSTLHHLHLSLHHAAAPPSSEDVGLYLKDCDGMNEGGTHVEGGPLGTLQNALAMDSRVCSLFFFCCVDDYTDHLFFADVALFYY